MNHYELIIGTDETDDEQRAIALAVLEISHTAIDDIIEANIVGHFGDDFGVRLLVATPHSMTMFDDVAESVETVPLQ